MAELKPFYGAYDPSMKLADMHVHTTKSDGIWGIRKYLHEAQRRGLSGIVFTDHDDISTGYEAREIAARENIPLEIIPAVEVSAQGAHILAIGVEDNIPMYRNVFETAHIISSRGGEVGFPHPEYFDTSSVKHKTILQVAEQGIRPHVEVFNAGVRDVRIAPWKRRNPDSNQSTKEFYEEHKEILGSALAGTDAHFRTVGRGLVAYEGSLSEALDNKTTSVVFNPQMERMLPWDPFVHLIRLRRMERRRAKRQEMEPVIVFAPAD